MVGEMSPSFSEKTKTFYQRLKLPANLPQII